MSFARQEELARLRQSGKKACTHSISVEIKATAHEPLPLHVGSRPCARCTLFLMVFL